MSILVLINIGSRDVMLNEQEIRPARSEGKRLIADYAAYAAQLSFPIVEPVLRYLLDRHPDVELLLYLFGTDQSDPKFRPTDTLYFIQLMARRLPEILGRRVNARTINVQEINPSYYDLAIEVYDRLLTEITLPDISVRYIALAGGVPACNTALLIQGVRHYGDNLQVVYTPQGGEPIPIRAGQQITDSFREAAAVERLTQLDFTNALPLLRALQFPFALCHLVEYAARRLDFDFQSARHCLDEALKTSDAETRRFIQDTLCHDLDTLLGKSNSHTRLATLLRELSWNAAICWRHHRYADFLARIYRFQEAALRYLVEKFFGLPTDISPAARQDTNKRWEKGLQAIPGLIEYFHTLSIDGEEFDWRDNGRLSHKALLSYALRKETTLIPDEQRAFYAALVERVNALDRLVELRHRTVVGHDFQGVSEETLLQVSPRGKGGQPISPDQAINEIARMISTHEKSQPVQSNPYEQIATFLLSRLQKG